MIDILGLLVVWFLWRTYETKRFSSLLRETSCLWMEIHFLDFNSPSIIDLLSDDPETGKKRMKEYKEKSDRVYAEHDVKFKRWKLLRMIF